MSAISWNEGLMAHSQHIVISSIIPNTGIPGVFCTPEELLDATWGQLEARVAWGKSGCLLSHMISTVPKLEILKPIIDAMEDILRIVPSRVQSLDYRRIPDMTTHQADQMFATVAYLAINNQLDDYHLGHFFRWVINEGLLHELSTFIRAKSTNVCVFSARLLRAMFFGLHPFDDHFTLDMLPFFEFLLSVANLPAFSGRVGGELLHRLAGSHNVEVAKLLVAGGADVDYVQWMDIYVNHTRMGTPLCHAVIRNNIQMVSLFISAGSDINKRVKSMLVEGEEETALIMAIRNDSYEAAMVLLEAGAEFDDSICVNGYSAVEYAKMNSRRIHEALLKKRRSSRAPDIHQLVLAAEKGGRLLSAFVLENNIVNEEVFERALRRAVKMGAIGAVRTLLNRGVDPDARLSRVADNVGGDLSELEKTRPILVAAGLRDAPVSDIVYLLIKAGAEVNDDVLMQICHLVARNNKGVFRVLREAGCNVSVFGPSAVESFAHDRKIFECALYLDIGAPINEYGVTGLSALQVAAFCHMPSDDGNVMHFLLDRGADVNLPASVDGGMTALQAAAWGGSTEVVDALIDAGANVRAPPARNRGFTVLEAAARACNLFQDDRVTSLKERELVLTFRKLLALGAPVNRMDGTDGTLLHDLIRRSRIDCLKLALQAGARVEDRDPGERAGMSTPLQVAAAEGQREALQLLLDNGADVNAVAGDEFGRTALQAATSAATSDPGIVAVLLAHNADINASPARKGGVTALQGAAIRGDLQIARMLLLSGADVNAAAALEEGRTALEGAAEHGRLEMMTLLLSAGATADPATGFSGAIRLAEDNWHFFIANLLREHEQLDHFLVAETGDSFWFQNNTMFTQGIILPENEG
jgi:ankyrin repeat protein